MEQEGDVLGGGTICNIVELARQYAQIPRQRTRTKSEYLSRGNTDTKKLRPAGWISAAQQAYPGRLGAGSHPSKEQGRSAASPCELVRRIMRMGCPCWQPSRIISVVRAK